MSEHEERVKRLQVYYIFCGQIISAHIILGLFLVNTHTIMGLFSI